MNRIIGYENEKKEAMQLKDMLLHAEKYEALGLRIPKGLLICGECGVGKSVLARSFEGNGIYLHSLDFSQLEDSDIAEAIKRAFEDVKANAPAVLLMDELDKSAGESMLYISRNMEKIRNILLRELDAVTAEDHILVIATCNDRDSLAASLKRSGRFDRHLVMELPDFNTRKMIAEAYFNEIGLRKDIDIDEVATLTIGLSGADIECLANEAGICATLKGKASIGMEDVRRALNRKEFGCEVGSTLSEGEKRLIAVHEAGHAIAAMYLDSDSLYGASIRPQGKSRGHIQYAPNRECIRKIVEIENEVTILLAGHVAEREILGTYLTGATEDLARAAYLVHFLVGNEAAYGYGSILFPANGCSRESTPASTMDATAEKITEKLEELDEVARNIVNEHRDVFDSIVDALIKKETLSKSELVRFISCDAC